VATRRILFTGLAVLALLQGCASTAGDYHSYKLYAGPERPIAELAILDIADVHAVTVDGLQVTRWDYGTVQLLPGTHTLLIEKGYGFSVMVEPSMHGTFENSLEVEVEAGRTYKVISDRTYGHGYRVYFWVEDAASGDLIAGVKKP
jgi:hypothetical protein